MCSLTLLLVYAHGVQVLCSAMLSTEKSSLDTPFIPAVIDIEDTNNAGDADAHCVPITPPSRSEVFPFPSAQTSAPPAQVHALYSLYRTIAGGLSSAYSTFVRLRWRLLLPLYHRVNLPYLHSLSLIELLCILAYIAVNAYYVAPLLYLLLWPRPLSLYMVDMVQAAYRMGAVGTYNLLAVWLPVTRHSLWNYLLGMSYDRARLYHIHISRYTLLLFTLHGAGLYAWIIYKNEFWHELLLGGWTGAMATGSLAMLGGLLILVTSFGLCRRRWWELFFRSHWVGLVIFTVFSMLHEPLVIRWQLAGVLLYAVDLLLRTYKWTKPVEVVSVTSQGEVTRIEWRAPSFEFSAGQFVLVCFPAISPLEWHPYSIASSPHHLPHIVLYSKRTGWWTRRLHELSLQSPPTASAASHLRMYVEGPYGSLTVQLPLYRHVMLVSGGLGVTPMLSIYHELVKRRGGELDDGVEGVAGDVQFVWSTRNKEYIKSVWRDMEQFDNNSPLQLVSPMFAQLPLSPTPFSPTSRASSSASTADDRFSRRFYLTASQSSLQHNNEEAGDAGWQLAKGRPPLSRIFNDMRTRMQQPQDEQPAAAAAAAAGGDLRCAVLVCGPEALIARCRRLCSRYSDAPYKCGQRICFDLHEETYEW